MGNCECGYIFGQTPNNVNLTINQGFPSQIQVLIDKIRQKQKTNIKNMKEHRLNDKLFRGTISNGKKVGYGQFYGNNNAYFGLFENDLPHGVGLLVKNYKDYIKGDFKEGKPHGEVKQKIGNSQFLGHYTNGQKAKGILKTEDYAYQGSFKRYKFDGYGILQFNNGDRYQGNFSNGLYHGDGKYQTPQQGQYHGQFRNGLYDGKGLFKWRNGYFYEGSYRNGVRNGFGKFTKGKDQHEGNWIDGQLQNNSNFFAPSESSLLKSS